MLLIGSMNLTRTRDRGNFFCPACEVNDSYRLRARRPFLTVYLIPLIPIGGIELFVQCDQCKSSWDVSVLDLNRESHEQAKNEQFSQEALRASVLSVLVDGVISEAEIEALQTISKKLLQCPLDREGLGELCSIAMANKIEAQNYLLTISKRWNFDQRRIALQAIFLATSVDGELTAARVKLLADLQELFEMSQLEYESAIVEAIELDLV